jgi:hypothetical protein
VRGTGGAGGSGIVILKYNIGSATIFTFKSSQKWTAPAGAVSVDYLCCCGGGGGGGANTTAGGRGAGGAGGMRTGTALAVTAGSEYTITVGAGGAGGSSAGFGDPGAKGSGFRIQHYYQHRRRFRCGWRRCWWRFRRLWWWRFK